MPQLSVGESVGKRRLKLALSYGRLLLLPPGLAEDSPGEPRQLVCHCLDRMEKENLCWVPMPPWLPLRCPSIGLQLLASSLVQTLVHPVGRHNEGRNRRQ